MIKYLDLSKDEVDFDFYFGETFTLGEIDFSRINIVKNNYFIPTKSTNQAIKSEIPPKKEIKKTEHKSTATVSNSKMMSSGRSKSKKEITENKLITKEIQLEIIDKKFKENIPVKALAKEYGINEIQIEQLINDYLFFGENLFAYSESKNTAEKKQHKRIIPKAKKVEIINKYLSGVASQRALAKEYGVSVTSISRWVNDYQKYGDKFL